MKKVAFFVEGLTERIFLEKLFAAVFASRHLAIEVKKIKGGTRIPITITAITTPNLTDQIKYYILIYDCGGDSNVRSYIEEQRASLINNGYEKILGLRDVYPIDRADIHKLLYGLNFKLQQKPIPVVFILAIMELEAWFIAEHTHFIKINSGLTVDIIRHTLGFDPSIDNMELKNQPAVDLNNCYNIVGDNYSKNEASLERTTSAIDYGEIYFNTRTRVNSLNLLLNEIESFFPVIRAD